MSEPQIKPRVWWRWQCWLRRRHVWMYGGQFRTCLTCAKVQRGNGLHEWESI